MKSNKILQLERAYNKRFKNINKSLLIDKDAGLLLFVEHLKYLRDCLIISTTEDDTKDNKIAAIVTAIAEFETYGSDEEDTKKAFHWNNFCEFVRLNMEEWLELDDSI